MSLAKVVIEKDKNRPYLVRMGVLAVIVLLVFNIIVNLFTRFNKKKDSYQKDILRSEYTQIKKLKTKCPGEQAGNPNAYLTIKYFYSPVCFWCVLEDQHLKELLESEGQAFKLEKYNRAVCDDVMQKYKLNLTPGFVFSTKDDVKEYTVDGYISKQNLAKVICDVTGYCVKVEDKQENQPSPESQQIKIEFN